MSLSIVVLAAGKGKRMLSSLPKVLHPIGGIPLLQHVVNTAAKLSPNIYVVYGFEGQTVQNNLQHLDVKWVEQKELLGTGDAVLQALPYINDDDQVLILLGDCPLISVTTLQHLLTISNHQVGLVTVELENPTGMGRVLLDKQQNVIGIVEEKDATPEQKQLKLTSTGIITAPARLLKKWLPQLSNANEQKEYLLPDIFALAVAEGLKVHSLLVKSIEEVAGINDRVQLAKLERYYQHHHAEQLMLSGVTLMDPARINIRGEIDIAYDVTLDVNVILEGKVIIGKGCYIGANCLLKDVTLGEAVRIEANSIIEGATIGDKAVIGPFARIRPTTTIKSEAKIGNFVEVKNCEFGEHSKANHLSYLGDATIGNDVNMGAGTIIVNYNGADKHRSVIEDGAFVGCDSQLISPVTIGKGAYIGAGSTITKDAPAEQLTLSRAQQTTVSGWKKPEKS